jgi:hypothetical protein
MKRPAVVLALLFLLLLLTRLCHSAIVWVEEAYPGAAALQILYGKTPYRDFWFDKPPLAPLLYILWGAHVGLPLRMAGALFLFACCLLLYRFAAGVWTVREGLWAASLLAFFLIFDVPSAVMALAPDLVMLLPHLAAVYLAWRRRAWLSGAMAGVAVLVNPKAALVLVACALWCGRSWPALAGGFAVVNAAALIVFAATGALPGYYRQVWVWGSIYSRDTFVAHPWAEGAKRTLAWLGFHAALVLPAAWYWWRERTGDAARVAGWAIVTAAGVILGWRFFPRYYFFLLPVLVLAAARGFCLMPPRWRVTFALPLIVPLVRFGPRYATLAADLLTGRETQWADLAMNQDSRAVASYLTRAARPGDTLLVWGYRPDIFLYTRLPAGAPFLDSQPLTGVIADRHLTQSKPSAPLLAAQNRLALTRYRPTFIVDGLGLYNPKLAITSYPDLAGWLEQYTVSSKTTNSVIYELQRPLSASAPGPARSPLLEKRGDPLLGVRR